MLKAPTDSFFLSFPGSNIHEEKLGNFKFILKGVTSISCHGYHKNEIVSNILKTLLTEHI